MNSSNGCVEIYLAARVIKGNTLDCSEEDFEVFADRIEHFIDFDKFQEWFGHVTVRANAVVTKN